MYYFGYKFFKLFVELPTFDFKICLFSLKIIPFYYQKQYLNILEYWNDK